MDRLHLPTRRYVPFIIAIAILALAAGSLGALGQAEGAGPTDTLTNQSADANRTITVSATGDVTAEADQAVVRLSVVATGDTADVARQRLAANVTSMREALTAANVSDDQITTSGYDVYQERLEPPRGPTGPPGSNGSDAAVQYVARQSFTITLNETDRAGEIIDVAVANGATNVDGVQFTLSEAAQENLTQDALREAMATARRNAETLAATENLSVEGVIHVTTTDLRPSPFAAEAALASDGGGGTTIDGGPVTVTATVQVVYAAN